MDGTELEGWQRVGHTVRRARIDIGFTNRENFAEACGVSVRVLSDLESGTRSNFSERVLSRLEEGLGWAPG
ncbi:helix-turn-helix domain-containing protein, partial [Mycolicibacterium sp.]|uniref:helix-turn-helix domain-containing protein n=1 Tax=Mycolicibacterium sp. TaxID=2320850 RepID=UPI00355F3011